MMLRHDPPEVLSGPDLPAEVAGEVDRVIVLDHLCCTAVAMQSGNIRALVVASSRRAALRRLSRRVAKVAPAGTPTA